MRRCLSLGLLTCFAGVLAWRSVLGMAPVPNPEDGRVIDRAYRSEYFALSYPLPSGWGEDLAGPGPTRSGYYVLSALISQGELTGTILVVAQDRFFAPRPFADIAEMARDFRREISGLPAMTIDREPSETTIAGHRFVRVDYSGLGLYRAMLATEIRCHVVSFNLMGRDREILAGLARSLDDLAFAAGTNAQSTVPACIADYAVAENVVRKVDPAAAEPRFTAIPVRLIIDADGGVRHVHVINASAAQRKNIEEALGQWRFRPSRIDGRPAEIETGLLFRFK